VPFQSGATPNECVLNTRCGKTASHDVPGLVNGISTFFLETEAKRVAVSVDVAGVVGELSPPQATRNAASEIATVEVKRERPKTEFCMMFP
jgi:hypothetical protein